MAKLRADQLLVDRGLAESRDAGAGADHGRAGVCRRRARSTSRGSRSPTTSTLDVRGRDHPWVSRGGIKLAHGARSFRLGRDRRGGDRRRLVDRRLHRCAAARAARRASMRSTAAPTSSRGSCAQDERVIVHEQTSARILTAAHIPEPVDLIVCDASFIGLAKVLDVPLGFAAPRRAAGRAGQAAVRGGARRGRQGRGGARSGRPCSASATRWPPGSTAQGLAGRRAWSKARSPAPRAMSSFCLPRGADPRLGAVWRGTPVIARCCFRTVRMVSGIRRTRAGA